MRAEILSDVAGKLLACDKPQEIIEELCLKVMYFLECHAFINYLVDFEKHCLHLNACAGFPEAAVREIEWLEFGVAACGCAARDGCPVIVEMIQESSDARIYFFKHFGIRAYACHPLMEQNKVIGTLAFCTRSRNSFSEDDLVLMKAVAEHVAVAISRIRTEQTVKMQQQHIIDVEKEKNHVLKKAIEMKDEFLTLISHEFKTPLTVINSAVQAMELICGNELSDKSKGFLNSIKQNSYRQLRLVNNLLDITRANSGQIRLNMRNVDIVSVTGSITESVNVYAEQKGVKLVFKSTLGQKLIGMDEEKYERILLNLLSNAIKFTPKGKSITVRTSLKTVDKKINARIEVTDQGLGIPEDKKDLIFERFGQVDSSLTRQAEGTGIGLSLVKLLVEALGGSISVKSTVGMGSTFTLLFPAVKVSEYPIDILLHEMNDNRLIQATAAEFSDIYF